MQRLGSGYNQNPRALPLAENAFGTGFAIVKTKDKNMTANELYQIVKTEIETRIAFWGERESRCQGEESRYKDTCTSRVTELTDLLAKLNDKMSVSGQPATDVETAADNYRDSQIPVEYPNYFTEDQIREAFIAGNDWRMARDLHK